MNIKCLEHHQKITLDQWDRDPDDMLMTVKCLPTLTVQAKAVQSCMFNPFPLVIVLCWNEGEARFPDALVGVCSECFLVLAIRVARGDAVTTSGSPTLFSS